MTVASRKRRSPVRLYVRFDLVEDELERPLGPQSWCVSVDDPSTTFTALLWGFARQKDAEIAMQFLAGLPVDWMASRRQMWRQCAAAGYPDRPSLMKAALERLQW